MEEFKNPHILLILLQESLFVGVRFLAVCLALLFVAVALAAGALCAIEAIPVIDSVIG